LATLTVLLFGTYAYWFFIYNQVEILPTWHENRPRGYWTVYDEPNYVAIFGFPHQVGWKVIGSLYQDGVLEEKALMTPTKCVIGCLNGILVVKQNSVSEAIAISFW
jgi:hypothetical protein